MISPNMSKDHDTEIFFQQSPELRLCRSAVSGLMREALAKGVPVRFQARGCSMSPFVRDGDVLTIVPLGRRFPRLGDMVAVAGPDAEPLLVHRVVGKGRGTVTVKGDNTLEPDGVAPAGWILGCVSEVRRQDKRVRIGHGPERAFIAILSRWGLLVPILFGVRKALQLFGLRSLQ